MVIQSMRQVMEQSQRIGVQFLIADLSLALTFLDVAESMQSAQNRQRNRQNALSAYETVMRLLPRVSPLHDERPILQSKLTELRQRLRELGYDLGPDTKNPSES